MENNVRLPDVICIGTYKCGTTWFFEQAAKHPRIYTPDYKELHYFSDLHGDGLWQNKSIDWYKAQFKNAKENQCALEISPGYLVDSSVAYKIKQYVGEPRFVCVLRDPVERLVSHYYYQQYGKIDLGFSLEELVNNPDVDHEGRWNLLNHGKYASNLKPYLELFDKENFLFLLQENFKSDPRHELKKFFEFVDVDTSYQTEDLNASINSARSLKSRKLYWVTYNIASFLQRNRLGFVRKGIKLTGIPTLIHRYNMRPFKKPRPTQYQVAKLREYYRDEVKALSDIVGMDMEKFWWDG